MVSLEKSRLLVSASNFIKQNLGTIGAGVGGLALGTGVGFAAGRASNRKRRKSRKSSKSRNSRKRNSTRNNKRRRYTPHTAGKRRDTSHRRIRYTSRGQPYVILENGRARFIKQSSAHNSRSRKGGRY